MAESPPLRILVIDDQKLFAESLEVVLRDMFDDKTEVISVDSPEYGLELLASSPFELIIVDLQMPSMDGFEFCRHAKHINEAALITVLTAFGYKEYVTRAFEAGASGYLLKDLSTSQLYDGLKSILAGHITMPAGSGDMIERRGLQAHIGSNRISELTRQERRVLRYIAQGFSNRDIADRMHLARQTVQNYVSGIYEKIGAEDRFEAIRLAIEAGLGESLTDDSETK